MMDMTPQLLDLLRLKGFKAELVKSPAFVVNTPSGDKIGLIKTKAGESIEAWFETLDRDDTIYLYGYVVEEFTDPVDMKLVTKHKVRYELESLLRS